MKLRPNIDSSEIECQCGCGFAKLAPAVLDIVQYLRNYYDKPVIMNKRHCACRCEEHNAEVGGSKTSQHLPDENGVGHAADVEVVGVDSKEVYEHLDWKYPTILGLGLYKTFVHIDDRVARAYRWDMS